MSAAKISGHKKPSREQLALEKLAIAEDIAWTLRENLAREAVRRAEAEAILRVVAIGLLTYTAVRTLRNLGEALSG
jgi:hypothetical protein